MIAEIIAFASLVIAVVALFLKTRSDRIALEVKVAEIARDVIASKLEFALQITNTKTASDLQIAALNERINAEFLHRNEMIENTRATNILVVKNLTEQILINASVNREDHLQLFSKLDDLKDFIIKEIASKK